MAHRPRSVKLTAEQQAVVDEPGSCLVKACPGSGKTRAIIAKIFKACDEAVKTPRKIACVTYTNAAVHEISGRLNQGGGVPSGVCEVSTIHTFCLQNVLRPFGHLLGDAIPKNFGILGPDSPELFAIGGEVFGGSINSQWTRDLLMNIKRRDGGIFVPAKVDKSQAQDFYRQITERGLLTFGDIVYFSEKLIDAFPFIRRSLASRFYRIIVDEFQDTTPEQARILSAIAGALRTEIMLVGDENQSIFSFGDARPDIFRSFAEEADFPIVEKPLTGNFRCSALIVDAAEKICARSPRMIAVGENKNCRLEVAQFASKTAAIGIVEHFIQRVRSENIGMGKCAILAPQWNELRSLGRSLAMSGIPVVGPGARPYRRASEFTNVAEAAAECSVAPSVEALLRLERALSFCLMTVNRGTYVRGDRYEKRKAVCLIKRQAAILYNKDVPAIDWLSALAEFSADTLASLSLIPPERKLQITTASKAMTSQIQENHKSFDVSQFGLNELAIFSNPANSITLSSIHSAKGLEWDAVALVDLHEGRIPHLDAADIEESRRLFYVGITRAKKLLMLFTHNNRNPSRFLRLLEEDAF